MFTEFQMDTVTFLNIFRDNLLKRKICVDYSGSLNAGILSPTNEVYVVDHVEFTQNYITRKDHTFTMEIGGTKTFAGKAPLITHEICLHIVSQNDLIMNGINASTAQFKIFCNINILFTLLIDDNKNCNAMFSYDSVDFEFRDPDDLRYLVTYLLTDEQKQSIRNAIAGNFSSYNAILDFSSINNLQSGMRVVNLNAAVVSDGQTLFYRIEFELRDGDYIINPRADTIASWQTFLNEEVTNRRGSRTWAMIYDESFLRMLVLEKTDESFTQMADKFTADPGTSVNWRFDGTPGLRIDFSGKVLKACNCLGNDMDLDVDVTTMIDISVPSANKLTTTMSTNYQPNEFELFCCAITMELLWPILSKMYLDQGLIKFAGCVTWLAYLAVFRAIYWRPGGGPHTKHNRGKWFGW